MAQETAAIKVTGNVDLAELLDAASSEPIPLERGGVIYRLEPEAADVWEGYDPDRLRAALEAAAGTITPEEADRWKEEVYRAREEGTRPITRP